MIRNSNQTEELSERLKELSCLYEITSIGAMHHDDPQMALSKIVQRLPVAWVHADIAVAEIHIDGQLYISGKIPNKPHSQSSDIVINGQIRGQVNIHYPECQDVKFLKEEKDLIEKAAHELAMIIERSELRLKEKALEQQMQRTDRLSILGEITAGIAHELNTPLASILGFSQFISDNSNEPQITKDADKIIQSAMHAREVVKKLMLFSCDLPGNVTVNDINDLIIHSLNLLKPVVKEANLSLEILPDPNSVQARVDQIQITQLIFNLVINSIHASRPGGKIVVEITSNAEEFTLKVTDNGFGIPTEIQSRMFEPFFTTKQLGEGSGLGLSVVHGIVKSHGGVILVESQLDNGTQFIIRIPLRKE